MVKNYATGICIANTTNKEIWPYNAKRMEFEKLNISYKSQQTRPIAYRKARALYHMYASRFMYTTINSGPSVTLVCAIQKYRYFSGHRH